jgi:hypothetical protein
MASGGGGLLGKLGSVAKVHRSYQPRIL